MKTRWVLALWAIAAAGAIGCRSQSRVPEPVPVDRVECAQCRMLVSNDTDGGEIVSSREETRFYDDIGCLASGWKAHHDEATAFVHVRDGGWSDAMNAWFAQTDARTPMGSGLVAFASQDDARKGSRDGRALSWDDVLKLNGDTK